MKVRSCRTKSRTEREPHPEFQPGEAAGAGDLPCVRMQDRTPEDLLPGLPDLPWSGGEKHFLFPTLESALLLVPLRCGHPALLVGCVRKKQSGLPSFCATEPLKESPKLSISGHCSLKQLIKMPDPQGPVTHSPVFICILKAEQLLGLAIRENVLKMHQAQSPERIFDLKAGSS